MKSLGRSLGFSIVETVVVVVIVGILMALAISNFSGSRETAFVNRAESELVIFTNAIRLYVTKYNEYPADVSRGIPSSLNEFISSSQQNTDWPNGPWPNSVYDYENWPNVDGQQTVQISIRFCPSGSSPLSECKFPKQTWAQGFDQQSSVYYCLKGNCRAHETTPKTHPGYCLNCPRNKAIGA